MGRSSLAGCLPERGNSCRPYQLPASRPHYLRRCHPDHPTGTQAWEICPRPTTPSASVILMAGARFKAKEAGARNSKP